jgi:hypothetical protein
MFFFVKKRGSRRRNSQEIQSDGKRALEIACSGFAQAVIARRVNASSGVRWKESLLSEAPRP